MGQQKTPWPTGPGGCGRTRCGVRRQVSSRSEVGTPYIVRQSCQTPLGSSRGTVDAVLRRLLLLAVLVGVAAAARQLLLAHNGPGAVGSPDRWPAVPRKLSD